MSRRHIVQRMPVLSRKPQTCGGIRTKETSKTRCKLPTGPCAPRVATYALSVSQIDSTLLVSVPPSDPLLVPSDVSTMLAEDRNVLRLMRNGLPRRVRLAGYLPMFAGHSSYTGKKEYAQENDDLEYATRSLPARESRRSSRFGLLLAAVLISCTTAVWHSWSSDITLGTLGGLSLEGACPQQSAIPPKEHGKLLAGLEKTFNSGDFKLGAYESLGGAVRIP